MSIHSQVSARLHYLDAAARTLALSAPATSAILEAEHDNLTRNSRLQRAKSRDEAVCNACGNIMVPGRTCNVKLTRIHRNTKLDVATKKLKNGRKKKPFKTDPVAVQKMLVYSCDRCGRQTRIEVNHTAKAITIAQQKKHTTTTNLTPNNESEGKINSVVPVTTLQQCALADAKSTPNVASKQRAKARKQGSLQAMLAKSKADSAITTRDTAFGLMDFMKHD